MENLDLLLLASFALAFGLVSKLLDRTPLTGPILFLAFGALVGPAGCSWLDLEIESETVKLLAEFTLALVLFHDAARIDLRLLRQNLGTPERLLWIGLPLTVLLGFVAALILLPEIGAWGAALLAALLAPTDAALGQAVVTQPAVPVRVRQALNVESGLNDGLIVPVVAVCLACAAGEDGGGALDWAVGALRTAGFGVFGGLGVGLVSARLLDAAEARGWMLAGARRIAVVMVPVVAFTAAELIHGSGFLAAFVAGLALGSTTKHIEPHLYDAAEDGGELLSLATWVAVGAAFTGTVLAHTSGTAVLYALLSLTVVRMAPVALSLIGTGFRRDTTLFLGWFGPRGLASIVFAIGVLDSETIAERELLFCVATWTIMLSVVLHGVTAGWLARGYGARLRDAGELPETEPVPEMRLKSRWSEPE